MNKITEINLNDIIPHPNNRCVGGFDQQKLEQLADSIRTIGVQLNVKTHLQTDCVKSISNNSLNL